MIQARATDASELTGLNNDPVLNILRVGDGVFHYQSGVWATGEGFKFKEINAAFRSAGVAIRLRPFGRIIQPTPDSATPIDESEISPVGVQVPRRGSIWPVVWNSRAAVSALRASIRDADVVWATLPSMLGLLAIEVNAGRKPCVTQLVGDPRRTIAALSRTVRTKLLSIGAAHLVRRAISKADGAIFVSEALRNAYLTNSKLPTIVANESRVRRAQLLDRASLADAQRTANARSPSIVYVGRLTPEKGLPVLIRALSIADGVDLTVIGSGPEQSRLEALIGGLGITARVRFLGGCSWGNGLLDLVRQHQALVLPSFTEGLPLVLVEAMSQGVPVIASAVGGVPELVHDGINGLLVSAGDVSGLAMAIARLTSDPNLRYRLAEEGLRAAESCTCELQWGKTVDFIMETVARRRGNLAPS